MLNRALAEFLRDYAVPLILPPGTTVRVACRHMRERSADAVLVAEEPGPVLGIVTGRVEDGRALGIVSHRHFSRLEETRLEEETRNFVALR